jgi:type IX secretion system PorP/SprF family membrane protein
MNQVKLNASYRLSIADAGRLGIGVGLGLFNMGMSPVWVTPQPNSIDPSLPQGFADNKFDLNAGLYWKGNQDYYVGLSSTHLTAPRLEDKTGIGPSGATTVTYDAARHYYMMGGKKFVDLINPGWHLDANVLVRTDLVKWSSDINARLMYEDLAYGGLTFRTFDAIALMLGARPFKLANPGTSMDHLLIGYSYDITINKLASISRGSHEMMVKYCYYLPPAPIQKSKHPRWL